MEEWVKDNIRLFADYLKRSRAIRAFLTKLDDADEAERLAGG